MDVTKDFAKAVMALATRHVTSVDKADLFMLVSVAYGQGEISIGKAAELLGLPIQAAAAALAEFDGSLGRYLKAKLEGAEAALHETIVKLQGLERTVEAERTTVLALIERKIHEGFAAGATMRLCLDCKEIVVGGPTRCVGCVRAGDLKKAFKTFVEAVMHGRENAGQFHAEVEVALAALGVL